MARTNVEASFRQSKQPRQQPPQEAFAPTKKPRTSLSAGRAPKKGATPARTRPTASDGEGDSGDGEPALPGAHEAAFARVWKEIKALPNDQVRRITLHVPSTAILALGALPAMQALRGAMIAELVNPPLEALDKLEDYALAAAHAHASVLPEDEGETELRVLVTEATPLRERLLLSAEAAASFGLLDAKQVAAIRRGSGHIDTAQDLWALATLFHKAWPTLRSRVACTQDDLARAAELSNRLLKALGRRNQGTDGANDPVEAQEQLGKAYELFRRAYEACRHAIVYLRRHEGDADDIAPPLGHSRRRARSASNDEPDPTEADPPTPEPTTSGEGEGEVDGG